MLTLLPIIFRYEAVSYTWGPPTFTCTLYLPTGVLRITPSLSQALRHFRSEERAVCLWADAICINQRKVEERNEQVSIMATIYAGASQVLVWLGEASRSDALPFWVIDALTTFFDENRDHFGDLESTSVEAEFSHWITGILCGSDFETWPCCDEPIGWSSNPFQHAMDAFD